MTNSLAIILIEPQMGENIGAAARACANFGLSDLRLVNPRDGWPNSKAEAMASGALGLVEVSVFETFAEAIADIQFLLATTARPRDMVKPVYTPAEAVQKMLQQTAHETKAGFLFGRERNGLENDEIAKAHGIITVPTSERFPSINLAQSVLLMGYEYMKQRVSLHGLSVQSTPLGKGSGGQVDHTDKPCDDDLGMASQKNLQQFLDRLENELEAGGFFRSEGLRPTMVRNITNMFTRAELTEQEVNTLQGIITALKKS